MHPLLSADDADAAHASGQLVPGVSPQALWLSHCFSQSPPEAPADVPEPHAARTTLTKVRDAIVLERAKSLIREVCGRMAARSKFQLASRSSIGGSQVDEESASSALESGSAGLTRRKVAGGVDGGELG